MPSAISVAARPGIRFGQGVRPPTPSHISLAQDAVLNAGWPIFTTAYQRACGRN
jgi:hypothetical protein